MLTDGLEGQVVAKLTRRAAAALLLLAALGGALWLRGGGAARDADALDAERGGVQRGGAAEGARGARGERGVSYRVRYQQRVELPGQPPLQLAVAGRWRVRELGGGRAVVRLLLEEGSAGREVAGAASAAGELPRQDELGEGAVLQVRDGALAAMAFSPGATARGRRLLTALATIFQRSSDGRGDGARWTALEEDLSGRYLAVYGRDGAVVTRRRERYVAGRDGEALSEAAARGLTAREDSRFELEGEQLRTARVQLEVEQRLQEGAPPLRLAVTASLERDDEDEGESGGDEAAAAGDADDAGDGGWLAAQPLGGHVDRPAARRAADLALLGGASLEQLLDEARRALGESSGARAQALARLAAAVRVRPEEAARLAELLRQPQEPALVRLVTGALSSTKVAAGTDALAGLLDGALPAGARPAVVAALSLAEPATATSLAALRRAMDGGDDAAAQAMLGMATHLRRLARDGAEAAARRQADAAFVELLGRLDRAEAGGAQRLLVTALGNAGEARALPALRQAMHSGDRALATAAVFSLRFVEGAEAEAGLREALEQPALALAALRAIAYRDAGTWRATVEQTAERFLGEDAIQLEARAILRRWQ